MAHVNPPEMDGWNLALRFGLELVALAGIGAAAWKVGSGGMRWVLVVVVPVVAAAIWGVFNVLDDPSRSGAAPVEVPGWTRFAIELLILGCGVAGLAFSGRRGLAVGLSVLVVVHYATSWSRVTWLLDA